MVKVRNIVEVQSRRKFLHFMGRSAALAYLLPLTSTIESCSTTNKLSGAPFPIRPIHPSRRDELLLSEGLSYQMLIKWNDTVNDNEHFGFNNDYIAFIPDNGSDSEGLMWVNHEYPKSLFINGLESGNVKTKQMVEKEQESVGGSIFKIRRDELGKWHVVSDNKNRRITARTPMPIVTDRKIKGSKAAIGTLANCAGGVTPWGTILTCEENYQDYYGETDYTSGKEKRVITPYSYGWEKYFNYPPEHYGWVVEVDVQTGEARKLTSLGRYCHECATIKVAADGRPVAYSGDDANDECLYKFISDKPGSLDKGKLYVANVELGKWLPLVYEDQDVLRQNFKDQTEVLVRCREAARLVGGSRLDRPEDIEIDPHDGAVIVAMTNNKPNGNYHGQLMRLVEKNNDPLALEFTTTTLIAGGPETGFACPDNMIFDKKGNLWFTTDIFGGDMESEYYEPFKNNGLFVIPMSGRDAGITIQVASAPVDAEFTGPWFSPDGKTLFLCVQHPGEMSRSLENLTSHWPEGGEAIPKPSVVCIQGEALNELMS